MYDYLCIFTVSLYQFLVLWWSPASLAANDFFAFWLCQALRQIQQEAEFFALCGLVSAVKRKISERRVRVGDLCGALSVTQTRKSMLWYLWYGMLTWVNVKPLMTQKVQKVFNRSEVVITNPLQAGRLWLYEEISGSWNQISYTAQLELLDNYALPSQKRCSLIRGDLIFNELWASWTFSTKWRSNAWGSWSLQSA